MLIRRLCSTATSVCAAIPNPNIYVHNVDAWCSNTLTQTLQSLTLKLDFISESEETTLIDEVHQPLRRLRYEQSHWDDAIHLYRETERTKWSAASKKILDRLKTSAFAADEALITHVHVLDLHQDGYIKPHIDSVRYCGHTIAGLSLLSDAVMRLVHEEQSEWIVDLLLKRRSLYILTDIARYSFKHEVLKQSESQFNGKPVPRERRISIMCRDMPSPNESNT